MFGCATPFAPVTPAPEPSNVPEVAEKESGLQGLHKRGEFVPTEWNSPLEKVYVLPPFKGSYDNSLAWKLLEAKAGDCIADIGCGYGGQARNFRKTLGPNGMVLARDISKKSIDRATRRGETDGINFELSTLEDVRISPNTIDGAYMSQVWAYLDNQEETRVAMLKSLLAALKPGGELVIVHYPSRWSPDGAKIVQSLDSMMRAAGFEAGRRWQFKDPEGRHGKSRMKNCATWQRIKPNGLVVFES
jgi:ubiquinone/menaquinone biosynthesis C-methylase UbiE